MSHAHGRFAWYELMTTDPTAAKAFYGTVAGWSVQDAGIPGMDYAMMTAGSTAVCGVMELPETARAAGAPPSWLGYVHVDDVDSSADQAKRLGGAVHVEPTDIPEVGRFAVVADPQGAAIALYKSLNPAPDSADNAMTPGHFGWHELYAANWEAVYPFYESLFGWRKDQAIPMGEMGIYQLFTPGGPAVGGMMTKPPHIPVPFWLYYISTDNIDAAMGRVGEAGGRVLYGPMEVPGGAFIVQAMDPQGAMFALVGPRG